MLPEFLFTVGNSMQEISRDDFQLLNGVVAGTSINPGCEQQQQQHRINSSSSPLSTTLGKQLQINASTENVNTAFETSMLSNSIKLEDSSSIDLFPTHSQTWQQHPMNSHEHAHHRLQHHLHQHHRLDGKLLLQSSDDPMICRGANSVVNDDDHPAEFKTLIAAVSNGRQQQQQQQLLQQQQQQPQQQQQQQKKTTQSLLPLQSATTPAPQRRPQNVGCSSLTKQQLKVKAGLMSAQNHIQNATASNQVVAANPTNTIPSAIVKSRSAAPKQKKKTALKLRFHHQALPPEYLSHYEAAQAAQKQKQQIVSKPTAAQTQLLQSQIKESHAVVKLTQTAKLPPPKSSHENVRSWLQKIAEIQRSAQQHQQQQQQQEAVPQTTSAKLSQPQLHNQPQNDANNNHQLSRMEVLTNAPTPSTISPVSLERVTLTEIVPQIQQTNDQIPSTQEPQKILLSQLPPAMKRVVNYADLPYMGEITLDNMKPRRGRKPKKADICHLIYKNYGTIFPGTPKNMFDPTQRNLLATKLKPERISEVGSGEQPLNLCLRDQSSSELYSISSGEEDEAHPTLSEITSNSPTPVATPSDLATDTLLAANMKIALPRLEEQPTASCLINGVTKQEPIAAEPKAMNSTTRSISATAPTTLMHPMNVYLQKLLESGTLIQHNGQAFGLPVETIQKDNQFALKIPIPSGLFLTPKREKTSPAPVSVPTPALTPNNLTLDYPEPMSTPSSIKSENSNSTMATTTTGSVNTTTLQLPPAPQKRKRSAIFIPPMPAENTTNPATEVSICKFKFTGGAKPTLQEKKMLSVDSDGNYRYYSGTGDKSMRGYEFFPRESVQQSAGLLPGINCSAASGGVVGFISAAERNALDIPPPSAGLSNELLQIPDSPTAGLLLPTTSTAHVVAPSTPSPQTPLFSSSPGLLHQQRQHNTQSNSTLMDRQLQQQQPSFQNSNPHIASTKESPAPIMLKHQNATEERKKKTRRSSAREKLEKTFKEKGFLIQTQQLESAEGATYCKFRQLKKFTRYLFRNWKDYLPEELQQANAAAAAAAAAAALTKQQNGSGPGVVLQDVSVAGHQAAIENILASHGFSSTGGVGGEQQQQQTQRLLRDTPVSSVVGGLNMSTTTGKREKL